MADGVTVRIDPHVHSEGSYDGHEPVELLLEYASDIGLDAIVVTDHDEIEQSRRAADLAPEFGLVGIPGVEVSTAAGHLLAIGVRTAPEPDRPVGTTVEAIHRLGGVAVVPHPFQRSRHGLRRRDLRATGAARRVDAVEVYNSMLFTGYRNRLAAAYARRHGYPGVGASDAHYLRNVGRAYTEVEIVADGVDSPADVDAGMLVDAIREGATDIDGRRTPVHRSARQYSRGAALKSTYLLTSWLPLVSARPTALAEV